MVLSVILLITLVVAIMFMFLFAIYSKPNRKPEKGCGEYFEIFNGSNNRNNGTPVASLYEKLSEQNIQLNYLKTK